MQYWLMKSEPSEFSYDDLVARPDQTEHWDGVRNYQARNMLRDQMKRGDQVFFYHSNCAEPGIVASPKFRGKVIPTIPLSTPTASIPIPPAIRPTRAGSWWT